MGWRVAHHIEGDRLWASRVWLWVLGFGCGALGFGRGALGFGCGALGFGRGVLGFGRGAPLPHMGVYGGRLLACSCQTIEGIHPVMHA